MKERSAIIWADDADMIVVERWRKRKLTSFWCHRWYRISEASQGRLIAFLLYGQGWIGVRRGLLVEGSYVRLIRDGMSGRQRDCYLQRANRK